ncbi:MAG: ribonuclease III [Sphingomicrobium sp.]
MSDVATYVTKALGVTPRDLKLYERALTHGSHGRESYERLEFLGDRVLGLVMASWLYERFPEEPEGKMSRRYNALVARETCAEVGRAIAVPSEIRLGRQAREDRATGSDNVVGDVVESLIGALYLDHGIDAAERFIRSEWATYLDSQRQAPVHPKSALQELAAARNWGTPVYEIIGRSGAHHAPTFKIRVSVRGGGDAEAEGASKQDAETAAATTLLEQLK